MLERDYDGVTAYRRSKLALIMATYDLADQLCARGVTVNALHPATFMPTQMVTEAGVTPRDTFIDGVEATLRLITADDVGPVTGTYFDGQREAQPLAQAHDPDVRRRLRERTLALVGLPAPLAA